MLRIPGAAVIGVWLAAGSALAQSGFGIASFDCTRAKTYGEVAVCGDAALAAKDKDLATLFGDLLGVTHDAAGLRKDQQAWRTRRDICTSASCVSEAYDARLRELSKRLAEPDPDSARTLTGTFTGKAQWGEHQTTLLFDEVALSMENEEVIRVPGRGDGSTAVDRAVAGMTLISADTKTDLARQLLERCGEGCAVDAAVEQVGRNEWVFRGITAVRPVAAPSKPASGLPLDVARDDPRRKPILDALRGPVEKELGQKVQFVVLGLREQRGFAFVTARPQGDGGARIDLAKTPYGQKRKDVPLDGDTLYALLEYDGSAWLVRTFVIAPTDVAWAGWREQYEAPPALFPGAAK